MPLLTFPKNDRNIKYSSLLNSKEYLGTPSSIFIMANSFLCPMPMDYNLLASEIRPATWVVDNLGNKSASIDCTGFTYVTIEVPAVSIPIKCTAVDLRSSRGWSIQQHVSWSCGALNSSGTQGQSVMFTKQPGSSQAYVGQVLTPVSGAIRFEGVVPSSMSVTLSLHTGDAKSSEGGWTFAYAGSVQTISYRVILRY